MFDVAIIGAGIAGMATAARLQAQGFSTIVFEAHGQPGGCAGFFRKRGFAFDVGATTLVDFAEGGLGGDFLAEIGLPPLEGEELPGYVAWLPDRMITLHRNHDLWAENRLAMLGNSLQHQQFWQLLDHLSAVFWNATRQSVKLPLRTPADVFQAIRSVSLQHVPLARYLNWTMGDALRAYHLRDDKPLVTLLGMLIEDTVHSTVDQAPLINSALGVSIRGAGLMRAQGGMWGFWQKLVTHYRALGGILRVGCRVEQVSGTQGQFTLRTQRGCFDAAQVVSAVPASLTAKIAPTPITKALQPYLVRDAQSLGGAMVVFLGVPENEVAGQMFTHHQLCQDYATPFGDGNNMFISVSADEDTDSAPIGHRAVMISTHCALEDWQGLSTTEYQAQKQRLGEQLIAYARRVYPRLGENPLVYEIGTPHSYEKFTSRPLGAVGGIRQTLANSNQYAIPHQLGMKGFWMVGDSTWPGLGTVACVLGSRIVAEGVSKSAQHVRHFSISRKKLYRKEVL